MAQQPDEVVPPQNAPAKNRAGEVFGAEGTNKTLPEPQAKDESEVQPGGQDGKYVASSPFIRKV